MSVPARPLGYAPSSNTHTRMPSAWASSMIASRLSHQPGPSQSGCGRDYLGVGPAALAYATWAVVLSRLPASRASSILFMVPVVAFLVGWAWLGEALTLFAMAGGILAMGGVAVVNTLGRARR